MRDVLQFVFTIALANTNTHTHTLIHYLKQRGLM
jgi:hypothetical protein